MKNTVEHNRQDHDFVKNKLQSIQNIKQDFKDLLDDENMKIIDNEIKAYCEREENMINDEKMKVC